MGAIRESALSQANDTASIRAALAALGPEIAARAEETEAARNVPADLVAKLKAAGAFRMAAPKSVGGAELAFPDMLGALEGLAQADASAAWVVLIANEGPGVLASFPESAMREVYEAGPDAIVVGSNAPVGKAARVEGGYRISGRWPWGSGAAHADWLFCNCLVPQEEGPPKQRIMLAPRAAAQLEDNWRVSGLNGTGSNDYTIDDLFVPEAHSCGGMLVPPRSLFPHALPIFATASMRFAAVALGIARGALDDVIALARANKRRAIAAQRTAEQPVFQNTLGEAETRWRAARAALMAEAQALQDGAAALPRGGALAAHPQIAAGNAMGVYIVRAATAITDACYTASGGSAVWAQAPIQRRFRDIHVLTQHIAVADSLLTHHGALLAGAEG